MRGPIALVAATGGREMPILLSNARVAPEGLLPLLSTSPRAGRAVSTMTAATAPWNATKSSSPLTFPSHTPTRRVRTTRRTTIGAGRMRIPRQPAQRL